MISLVANSTASKKAKGREYQKEIAADIILSFGCDPEDVISRPMGSPGADIIMSKAARKKFPFAVECKRSERINAYAAMEQAEKNAVKEGLHPLVVMRQLRAKSYAVIRWDDLLAILKALHREP